MAKTYPPKYEMFYQRLSRITGMSKADVDIFIIKMIKVIETDLNHDGEVVLPYLGKFYLKRLPPRKRSIKDFATDERYTVDIPARDKLKFTVNRKFNKLFR